MLQTHAITLLHEQTIAEKDEEKEKEDRLKTDTEKQLDTLWEHHKENQAHAKGAQLLERERQRAKMLVCNHLEKL